MNLYNPVLTYEFTYKGTRYITYYTAEHHYINFTYHMKMTNKMEKMTER